MVEDKIQWAEMQARIKHTMTRADFKILCELHAKYFSHKYTEPCTCNKRMIRKWLEQVDSKLK